MPGTISSISARIVPKTPSTGPARPGSGVRKTASATAVSTMSSRVWPLRNEVLAPNSRATSPRFSPPRTLCAACCAASSEEKRACLKLRRSGSPKVAARAS